MPPTWFSICKMLRAHAMLAANISCRRVRLLILQYPDNLAFVELALTHNSYLL
jgi:hypothetical protein